MAPGHGYQRLQFIGRQPGGRRANDRRRRDYHHQLLRRRKSHARLQRDGRMQGRPGTQRAISCLGPGPAKHPRELLKRRPHAHAKRSGHCGLRRIARARRPKIPVGTQRRTQRTRHNGPVPVKRSLGRRDRRNHPCRLRLQHSRAVVTSG